MNDDNIVHLPGPPQPTDRAYPTADCDSARPVPIGQIEAGDLGFKDVEAAFNMRDWLQAACEAKGARMIGGGFGMGQADIDVELEGCRFNISIRPV